MQDYVQIAIDGPAGAGKSTVAKALAETLHYIYLDTGAMYRAVAWLVLQRNVSLDDSQGLKALLADLTLRFEDEGRRLYCNGTEVTEAIRTPEISNTVSAVAALPMVREALVEKQRQIASTCNVVMDGRDIGTVVLPQAQVKLFLTASLEERTKRRLLELMAKGVQVDYDTLKAEIAARDLQDSQRAVAPLKAAADAVVVDTSNLSLEDVIKKLFIIIGNKGFHHSIDSL